MFQLKFENCTTIRNTWRVAKQLFKTKGNAVHFRTMIWQYNKYIHCTLVNAVLYKVYCVLSTLYS